MRGHLRLQGLAHGAITGHQQADVRPVLGDLDERLHGHIRTVALFKATKVEGIYDRDPVRHDDATMFTKLSYDRFLADRIGVMDSTAVALCRDNRLPIRVFKLTTRGNIKRVCKGEPIGTVVSEEG